ncbi:hypothetical protein NE237_031513 [Protea cynaroides]|uniref:Ubiquitin-like domain-containing protein n=1 Tax=Protea cynaroides TaxID=273540 RepID=A0A9Q0L2L1_9MAGN|nr:hypothetical protein NE237_031513 [Protea cynaroides]
MRKECSIDMKLPMQILVRTYRGNTITLQVEKSDTIYEVMAKIREKKLIPPRLQLVFSGRCLEGRNLADYNVIHVSTLHLYKPIPSESLEQIFVCTPNGFTIAVEITQLDTIVDVKNKIRNRIQVPPPLQKLTHEQEVLEDHKTLEHYGIIAGSKLYLSYP